MLAGRATANIVRRPFYGQDLILQMDAIGVGSLPITVLIGFFSGVIMALQMSRALSQYGATGQVGQITAITLVREMGPVLTALLIAGRNASGIASELGSMKVSEQIGGYMVAVPLLRLTTGAQYWNNAWRSLEYNDIAQGLLKPFLFAVIIALVGCLYGMRTSGGTQGVGKATTQAVVVASVWIFIVTAVITRIFVNL